MLLIGMLTAALAADHEVAVEAAWIVGGDNAWHTLASRGAYGSIGVRGGVAVHERVAIVAGYQYGAVGAEIGAWSEDDWEGEDAYTGAFSSAAHAFLGHRLMLGAKADVPMANYFAPYALVHGDALIGTVRLDDDAEDDENVTQRARTGATGGFGGALGVSFPVETASPGLKVTPYLELGYDWFAPLSLGDLGAVQPRGFAGRAGVGLQF